MKLSRPFKSGLFRVLTFKVSLWVLALMFIIGFSCYQFGFFKKTTKTTSYSSTVVQSLEKAEEVVFLNAGINKVRTLTKPLKDSLHIRRGAIIQENSPIHHKLHR